MTDYNITVEEQPAEEPVTAAELHEHLALNVDLSAVQILLETYITAARERFEDETDGRVVLPTSFRQHMRCVYEDVKLYRGNVLSVDGVTYYDTDDEPQEFNDFTADVTGTPALVVLQNMPTTSSTRTRPITIDFTAGWATVDEVPKSVRLAIMLLAGHYYRVREGVSEIAYDDIPYGFKSICAKYRTGLGGV